MIININRNAIVVFIAAIISLLLVAHIGGLVWQDVLKKDSGWSLIRLINLNVEANIPTWFSSTMLLFCAFLVGLIGVCHKKNKEPYALHWILLAVIFVFLSCDETAQIHEWTVTHVHKIVGGKFEFTRYIGWVVPYAILLLVFLVSYIRFFFHLPKRIKFLFAASGFIYVGAGIKKI